MISKEDQNILKEGWRDFVTFRGQVLNFLTVSNLMGFAIWLFLTLQTGAFDLFTWIKSLGFALNVFVAIYVADSIWFKMKAQNMDFPFSLIGFYSRIPYHILIGIVVFVPFFKYGLQDDIVSLKFAGAILFELVTQCFVFWFLLNRLRKLYLVNI